MFEDHCSNTRTISSQLEQSKSQSWLLIGRSWGAIKNYSCLDPTSQPTPGLLPGKSHERRGLVRCSPWGREELDMTEQLCFHFSLSCIGAGNGNPLWYSCLENPRDGRAWWAAIYGVAQSQIRLKRLSSSSSSSSSRPYVKPIY